MRNIRRKLLSQNFLNNHKLVSNLVGSSSIRKTDLVLEIGPGSGVITSKLLNKAGHVIAVELDTYWYIQLDRKFVSEEKLTLYKADILSHPLPKLPYKVFANIPFAIEGKIIRKLINDPNPPLDCYLVVMVKLAERLMAKNINNLFSAKHKPWFDFSIIHQFKKSDFSPEPSVDAVLLRFKRKETALLADAHREKYKEFVSVGYGQGGLVKNNLKMIFPANEINHALHKLSVSRKVKPSQLSFGQWVELYKELNRIKN